MSNLAQRILVAIVGVPVILWCAYTGGYVFGFLVALAQVLAIYEFYLLSEVNGAKPHTIIGTVAALALTCVFLHVRIEHTLTSWLTSQGITYSFPAESLLVVFIFAVLGIASLLIELKRIKVSEVNESLVNTAATVFGVTYVGLSLAMFIGVREMFSHLPVLPYLSRSGLATLVEADIDRLGGVFVIALFVAIWVCDSAAYFIGRAFGRRKLFERVSPNKTWAGAVAGFLGTAVVFWICSRTELGKIFRGYDWIVFTIIVGVFGQVSDLAESLLKRDAHIKDSSGLLPGHGGVLDRFDSLLFVAPLVYLYLALVVFPFR